MFFGFVCDKARRIETILIIVIAKHLNRIEGIWAFTKQLFTRKQYFIYQLTATNR